MALSMTHNGQQDTSTDGTSWTTISFTPTNGVPTIIVIDASGPTAAPTLTGQAGSGWATTITKIRDLVNYQSIYLVVPTSSTAGTITVDWGAETMNAAAIDIEEVTGGLDTTTPIAQSNESSGTGTTASTTLSAFGAGAIGFCTVHAGSETITFTPESIAGGGDADWTALDSGWSYASPNRAGATAWTSSSDTSPSIGLSASTSWYFIALELQPAGASGGIGALAGEGGLAGGEMGLAGGSGRLARVMTKLGNLWVPDTRLIRPRLIVPVGIALQGA